MYGRKALGTVAYLGGLPAVLEAFAWSWSQMVGYNAEFMGDVHTLRSTISDHAPARNNLAATFLGDWLIQFDTDHQFDPDVAARMVRAADEFGLDVLSAVYQMKTPPHVPVLYQWVQVGGRDALQPLARWPADARVLQIGSAGGGCLFVRRFVFDRIVGELGEQPFDKIAPFSEDHSFFLRLRRLGINAYAAMQIHCHHLRVAPVTMGDLDDSGLLVSDPFAVEGFAA